MSLSVCVERAHELSRVISEYVWDCDCMLLSGGVDTTFVGLSKSRWNGRFKYAVTVVYDDAGVDLEYARLVSRRVAEKHVVVRFGLREADEALPHVLAIIRSIDPVEVSCDIPLYIGLKKCLELGCEKVATGDGGDELFAGYSFLLKKTPEYILEWVRSVPDKWFLPSKLIGEHLGVKVKQSFTCKEAIELARKTPFECMVNEHDGVKYGKYLLRLLIQEEGYPSIAWRRKDPVNHGSGSVLLIKTWASRASLEHYRSHDLNVEFTNRFKPHIYLYSVYRELGLKKPAFKGGIPCPICGCSVSNKFCRFCGAVVDSKGKLVAMHSDGII